MAGIVQQMAGLMEDNVKKIILCLLLIAFIFIPSLLFAGTWCQWDGSAGTNCQSTNRTFITINNVRVTVSAENLNPRGWYELTVTQPVVGADQVVDETVWEFASNQISKTWTVRDLTAQEILERDAEAMSLMDYLQWKAIVQFTSATSEQITTFLTANHPEIVDAYLARKALEEQ